MKFKVGAKVLRVRVCFVAGRGGREIIYAVLKDVEDARE